MFTGIVEETGAVLAREATAEGVRLRLSTSFADLERGDSVSVSGTCLTVEDHGRRDRAGADDRTETNAATETDAESVVGPDRDRWFTVFLAEETRERTYLDELAAGDPVNLERAMPADGRFDGHVVQGHADGTAEVAAIEDLGDDWRFRFSLPADLAGYVVEKGSITVDGVSLTVAGLSTEAFAVAIVPETYRLTALSSKAVGDPVHLEVDVIAKYVERLVAEGD